MLGAGDQDTTTSSPLMGGCDSHPKTIVAGRQRNDRGPRDEAGQAGSSDDLPSELSELHKPALKLHWLRLGARSIAWWCDDRRRWLGTVEMGNA
jgi:hypothetical protein